MGQAGAAHEAEGENYLSTIEEQVTQVDTSQKAVAQEEGEGENNVTKAKCLAAISLQEAVAREENDCGHLAQPQVAIKSTQVDMSPEAVAQEDNEGENAVKTVGCLAVVLLHEAVMREVEGENNCEHFA